MRLRRSIRIPAVYFSRVMFCHARRKIRRPGRCLCHCKISIQCFESVQYQCKFFHWNCNFVHCQKVCFAVQNLHCFGYFRPHFGAVFFYVLELLNEAVQKQNGCSGSRPQQYPLGAVSCAWRWPPQPGRASSDTSCSHHFQSSSPAQSITSAVTMVQEKLSASPCPFPSSFTALSPEDVDVKSSRAGLFFVEAFAHSSITLKRCPWLHIAPMRPALATKSAHSLPGSPRHWNQPLLEKPPLPGGSWSLRGTARFFTSCAAYFVANWRPTTAAALISAACAAGAQTAKLPASLQGPQLAPNKSCGPSSVTRNQTAPEPASFDLTWPSGAELCRIICEHDLLDHVVCPLGPRPRLPFLHCAGCNSTRCPSQGSLLPWVW